VAGLVTSFGSGAMTNSISDIADDAAGYFVIGSNTTEQHPVIGIKIRKAVRERGARLIVADPRLIDLTEMADIHLQLRPGTNVALLNGLMNVIIAEGLHDEEFIAGRTEEFEALREMVAKYTPERAAEITGVPAEQIVAAARMMGSTKPFALLYAMGITQHSHGTNNVLSCANLQMLLGNMGVPGGGVNPLRGQNNVQGACDLGGLPNVYPGYQTVTSAESQAKFAEAWGGTGSDQVGLTVVEMMNAAEEGRVKALYIMGEDPMTSDPDVNHVRHCLESLDFLVVQDIFPTETTPYADVILPGASFAEKEGTFTNTERRVQLVRQAIPPLGDSRPDWWIVAELAKRVQAKLGREPEAPFAGWDYDAPAQIMDEIAELTPIYAGVSYARLEAGEQLQWPVKDKDHPGTPVLHVGRFSRGLGHFTAIDHLDPQELPDEEFPFMLTTGRVLYHWHGGEMTRRASGLLEIYPQALIEINPEDAQRIGLNGKEMVRVRSRRGEIVARAQVTERVGPGLIFATFHFPEALANLLTIAALDPVAKIPEYKVCAVQIEAA
jgi:formate dehydrogenase alpha subunit